VAKIYQVEISLFQKRLLQGKKSQCYFFMDFAYEGQLAHVQKKKK